MSFSWPGNPPFWLVAHDRTEIFRLRLAAFYFAAGVARYFATVTSKLKCIRSRPSTLPSDDR